MRFAIRNRCLRISLRGAMVVIAIVSLVLAREVNRVRIEREAGRKVREVGGDIFLGYRDDPSGKPKGFVPTRFPQWMINLVGEEYFVTIVTVNFDNAPSGFVSTQGSQAQDAQLELLKRTPNVRELHLRNNRQFTDKCLKHAVQLKRLRVLSAAYTSIRGTGLEQFQSHPSLELANFNHSPFTDEGLKYLSTCSKLEYLSVHTTKITDRGLPFLTSAKLLKQVDLRGNSLSAEACAGVERALPNCKVLWDRAKFEGPGSGLTLHTP